MTISKGEIWGEPGGLPHGAPIADSDAALRALWEPAVLAGSTPPIAGLIGGDLARTCGAPGTVGRLTSPDARRLPIDVIEVAAEGHRYVVVAHVIARRTWWHGPVVAAMNAQFLGSWDVAPRSHPNDGRVDLLEADLAIGDRWKARGRLPTGTHVPHPGIRETRVKRRTIELDRPAHLWIDGTRVATASTFEITARPDTGHIVV